MRRELLTYWYLKDRVGYMEIIKDGETIGRIHDDYCKRSDEEIKEILDNVAQKAYQHLAAKEKTT